MTTLRVGPLDRHRGYLGEPPHPPQKQALVAVEVSICLQPFKLVGECQGHFEPVQIHISFCGYVVPCDGVRDEWDRHTKMGSQ